MYIPNLTKFVLTSTVLFIHVLILCSFEKRKLKRHVPGYLVITTRYITAVSAFFLTFFTVLIVDLPVFLADQKKTKLEESQENDRAQWRRRNARITCNEITGYLKNILCFFSIIFCCSRTIWYVIFHNQNKYCLNNIYVLLVSAIHKSKNRNGVSQSN